MKKHFAMAVLLSACGPAASMMAPDFCDERPACAPDGIVFELQRLSVARMKCDVSSEESPVMRRYDAVTISLKGEPSQFKIHFALAGSGPSTDSYAFRVRLDDEKRVTRDEKGEWKSWQYREGDTAENSFYLSEDSTAHFYFSSLDSRGGLRVTCSN